ncbi:hypothetical protein P4118_10950 [Pseudomonas aeruginosa]|nr:hypothetical protein [Pseudomonas aeruginosa]
MSFKPPGRSFRSSRPRSYIQFHLYHKEEEGQDRALALLVLSIVEPSDEPSYLRIELQEESLQGNPDTE